MGRLHDRLDRLRASFAERAPEEARTIMSRATSDLRDSGILDGIPKVGDELVPFTLPDTEGNDVSSADLLSKGPLVVTVYRGQW